MLRCSAAVRIRIATQRTVARTRSRMPRSRAFVRHALARVSHL